MILEEELAKYDSLKHLECDGMSLVISYRLTQLNVEHWIMTGALFHNGELVIKPHLWVALNDGARIVDYRARMWAGESDDIPHGIFRPEDYSNVRYEGRRTLRDVTKLVYDVLTEDRWRS
jgi:hypothetical protein